MKGNDFYVLPCDDSFPFILCAASFQSFSFPFNATMKKNAVISLACAGAWRSPNLIAGKKTRWRSA